MSTITSIPIPTFSPLPFTVETVREVRGKTIGTGRDLPWVRDSKLAPELLFFATFGEAQEVAARKHLLSDSYRYVAIVRASNAGDLARQRLAQIGESLSSGIEAIMQSESELLAPAAFPEFGGVSYADDILGAARDMLDSFNEVDGDPVSMGWVGASGLP